MKIVSYYARESTANMGGVNKSRSDWMNALSRLGHQVTVVSPEGGFNSRTLLDPKTACVELKHYGTGRASYVPSVSLIDVLRNADLLYLHEGWTLSNIVAATCARLTRTPYIVMPHGVYEEMIVQTLRNITGRRQLEQLLLEGAAGVHLFFDSEREEVAKIAPAARTFVAPTGFDPRELPGTELPEAPISREPYIAWLGRYDVYHKGIDILLEAQASLPRECRPRIVMAGQDYKGGKAEVCDLVEMLDIADSVDVRGAVTAEQVNSFLAQSIGFIHSPRWECLGRTVVESLLTQTPTAVALTAHIARQMQADRIGLVFSLDRNSVAEALLSVGKMDRESAKRGRDWAIDYFSWSTSARRTSDFLESAAKQESAIGR